MNLIDAIALLAVLQYLAFGGLVAQARGRYGVKAPAVTGHPHFERAHRVQMNTLELLVAFLPALYLAARYAAVPYVAAAGVCYLLGRLVYWRAYVADPGSRALGFALSIAPVLGLTLWALVGAVRAALA